MYEYSIMLDYCFLEGINENERYAVVKIRYPEKIGVGFEFQDWDHEQDWVVTTIDKKPIIDVDYDGKKEFSSIYYFGKAEVKK